MITKPDYPVIGIVGPCGSGKSTLAATLRSYPLNIRHIAQEHSYVPDMWQRLSNPVALIYLDASYQTATSRRRLNWTLQEYQEQLYRLRHAREHADICISTDGLTPTEVAEKAIHFLMMLKLLPIPSDKK